MAHILEPGSRDYIESSVVVGGQYNGQTLSHIARTRDGMLYLWEISQGARRPKWLSEHNDELIRQFFQIPERLQALNALLKQIEREEGHEQRRKNRHRDG